MRKNYLWAEETTSPRKELCESPKKMPVSSSFQDLPCGVFIKLKSLAWCSEVVQLVKTHLLPTSAGSLLPYNMPGKN